MNVVALEPRRRSEAIAEELESMILAGDLAVGDRLDETRLAERFAVSRTPLREALHRLEASGLVELVPHRGAFVRGAEPHEMVEMFEVMAELEALAGRLASRRASEDRLDEIDRHRRACEEAATPDEYYRANERFHGAIYEASGNAYLEAQAKQLHARLRPFRRLQLRVRGRMRQSIEEHRLIVEALRAGDEREAAQRLRDHVTIQGERFGDFLASLRDLG